MKNTSSINNKKASPLVNAAIVAILLFTALPIALFGIIQILPPLSDAPAKTATVEDDATAKRSAAAERRAERREARKAKELAAAKARTENTMVTFDPGFDMGNFGMMPAPDMGNFGMMPMNMEFDGGGMPGPGFGGFGDFRGFGGFSDAGGFFGDQV